MENKGKVVNIKDNVPFDVYIGRGSKFGNIYSHFPSSAALYQVSSREEAIECFEEYLLSRPDLIEAAQKELLDKVLGCFCFPLKCHGEVLLRYASTRTLYRPVSLEEYKLIEEAKFKAFPSRLPDQPIFYPERYFVSLEYANQIAERWNKAGHVLRFYVDLDYISQYETHIVGSRTHEEYWIPAEDLEAFNASIVGTIQPIRKIIT